MSWEFPYLQKGRQFFPIIDIKLMHIKNEITIKTLVDSGASFSVFWAEIAEYLGVEIEKGTRVYLEGIGGRILGYIHTMNLKMGDFAFRCKVVFSRELTVSFNILGRDNFFVPFHITFRERDKMIVLEKA